MLSTVQINPFLPLNSSTLSYIASCSKGWESDNQYLPNIYHSSNKDLASWCAKSLLAWSPFIFPVGVITQMKNPLFSQLSRFLHVIHMEQQTFLCWLQKSPSTQPDVEYQMRKGARKNNPWTERRWGSGLRCGKHSTAWSRCSFSCPWLFNRDHLQTLLLTLLMVTVLTPFWPSELGLTVLYTGFP